MAQNSTKATPQNRATYWRRTRLLTFQLLLAWFLVTFGVIFFARELSTITLFGWPVSFYMAAQGTVLIYVAIIAIYVWRMQRYDKILKSDDTNG